MKKKLLSALLCAAMVGTMLTGCGSSNQAPAAQESGAQAETEGAAQTERRAQKGEGQQPDDVGHDDIPAYKPIQRLHETPQRNLKQRAAALVDLQGIVRKTE